MTLCHSICCIYPDDAIPDAVYESSSTNCNFTFCHVVPVEMPSERIANFVLQLYVCIYVFHGAYNYSGLVRQVSRFSNVSVSAWRYMSYSRLLELGAEQSRVVRHVKPPRCGEASRRSRALRRVPNQAIGALVQSFYPLSYPSALMLQLSTRFYAGADSCCNLKQA